MDAEGQGGAGPGRRGRVALQCVASSWGSCSRSRWRPLTGTEPSRVIFTLTRDTRGSMGRWEEGGNVAHARCGRCGQGLLRGSLWRHADAVGAVGTVTQQR